MYLTGTIPVANVPTAIPSVTFTGANPGDMAGSSVSLMGVVNAGQPNEILIGAPGFNSSSGTAYLIPGRANLTGTFSLSTAEASPLSGVQFILNFTNSSSFAPNLFGSSVSGRLQTTANTADLDNEGDFIVGDPGYNVNQSTARTGAGGAQIVEGGLITVPIPTSTTITTQIGVGKAPPGPFSINATTPANLQIFVDSTLNSSPTSFMPVTDINPATVKVNGVAFPGATITEDPNQGDWQNGISHSDCHDQPSGGTQPSERRRHDHDHRADAIDLAAVRPNLDRHGHGDGDGGSVTPVISGLAGLPTGPNLLINFLSPYGANQYTPSLSAFGLQLPTDTGVRSSCAVPSAARLPSTDLLVQPSWQDRGPVSDQPRAAYRPRRPGPGSDDAQQHGVRPQPVPRNGQLQLHAQGAEGRDSVGGHSHAVDSPALPGRAASLRRGDDLREPLGEAVESGAAIVGVDVDVDQAEAFHVRDGGLEGGIELADQIHLEPEPRTDDFGDLVIGPVLNVIEGAVQEEPLGRVTVVVRTTTIGFRP